MKKENGITLVSLVLYIVVMLMVLALMSVILSDFNRNTEAIQEDTEEILEFSKFNTYFLKEIKSIGNKIDSISDNYILFTSGNSFSLSENKIYYNNIKICDGVQNIQFSSRKDDEDKYRSIVNVTVTFKSFEKTMNYKLEEIY